MRKSTLSVLMIGVTVLTVMALLIWPGIASSALPSERRIKVEATEITLGKVEKAVSVSGILCYQGEFFSVVPQGGMVAKVYVAEGDAVKKDQVLYRLDTTMEEALLEKAYSALAKVQAQEDAIFTAISKVPSLSSLEASELSYEDLMATQVMELEATIESMTVRAYQDGQVLSVFCRQGELINGGNPGALLASDTQEIRTQVTARDRTKIQQGMQARIGYEGEQVTLGTVTHVGALTLDSTTGLTTAQVVLALDHEVALPIGAQLEVDILLETAAGVPVVPMEALTAKDTLWQVYEGRAYSLTPTLSLMDDRQAWVQGVCLGIQVILNPPEDMLEGQRVKVQEAAK